MEKLQSIKVFNNLILKDEGEIPLTKTVKLRDQLKREIEDLQAKLLINQNKKVNQQEIIEELIKFSLNHAENIFGSIEKEVLSEEDYALEVLDKPMKWGINDSSKDIDEYLYG